MTFVLIISILAGLTAPPVFAFARLPENEPSLQEYQNEDKCFPLEEAWYVQYRNFADDPYFGGNATCVRATEAGCFTNGSAPLRIELDPNVSIEVIVTLTHSPSYTVNNIMNLQTTSGPSVNFNLTTAYSDCTKCMVYRHSYANSGQGCSYWVPESQLGVKNTCCEFIFDLLCGPSPKYQIYQNCTYDA